MAEMATAAPSSAVICRRATGGGATKATERSPGRLSDIGRCSGRSRASMVRRESIGAPGRLSSRLTTMPPAADEGVALEIAI